MHFLHLEKVDYNAKINLRNINLKRLKYLNPYTKNLQTI